MTSLILSFASCLRLVFKWLIIELPARGSKIFVSCRMLSAIVICIYAGTAVFLEVYGAVIYVALRRSSVWFETPWYLTIFDSPYWVLDSPKRLSSDYKWAIEGNSVCLSISKGFLYVVYWSKAESPLIWLFSTLLGRPSMSPSWFGLMSPIVRLMLALRRTCKDVIRIFVLVWTLFILAAINCFSAFKHGTA